MIEKKSAETLVSGTSSEVSPPLESTPRPEGRLHFQQEFLRAHPPRVRFAADIREGNRADPSKVDHFEFMMALMEAHPIIPLEVCTFGSDLLDARRALAYQIIIRQLGHTRSLVANANIRNRVGVGTSLRCMLEMYAFAQFFNQPDRLSDYRLIEVFLLGQSFAVGGWYEWEHVWEETHGEPMPQDARQFFEKLIGLPRLNKILKPAHEGDKGFSFLYWRYSEYVHPAFARPRAEFEEAIGHGDPMSFGSSQYYEQEVKEGAPMKLILEDIGAGSFCLEMFWPIMLNIDPHFDDELRPRIVQILTDLGFDKS
ncbi:MAG TPA: hypothetical protein VFF64_06370 [Candidatus Eremiobacteraceae bacterium]|nr:hypothetical protein [Candidatus Eremiobacteraceae bacterium]